MKTNNKNEIIKNIDKNFSASKKITKDELEISLNEIYLDDLILEQKHMKSSFEKNRSSFTIQDNSFSKGITQDFAKNSLFISSIYLKSIYKKILFSLIPFSFLIFLGFGVVFAFADPDLLTTLSDSQPHSAPENQIMEAAFLSFLALILPASYVCLYCTSVFIQEIRQDNQISRIRGKGVTKEQIYINIIVVTTLIAIVFILFTFYGIANLSMQIGKNFTAPNENYYLFDSMPNGSLFIFVIFTPAALTSLGVLLGFKINSFKTLFIIIFVLFVYSFITYLQVNEVLTMSKEDFADYHGNAGIVKVLYWLLIKGNPLFYLFYGLFGNIHFATHSYTGLASKKSWEILNYISLVMNVSITIAITSFYKKIVNFNPIK